MLIVRKEAYLSDKERESKWDHITSCCCSAALQQKKQHVLCTTWEQTSSVSLAGELMHWELQLWMWNLNDEGGRSVLLGRLRLSLSQSVWEGMDHSALVCKHLPEHCSAFWWKSAQRFKFNQTWRWGWGEHCLVKVMQTNSRPNRMLIEVESHMICACFTLHVGLFVEKHLNSSGR